MALFSLTYVPALNANAVPEAGAQLEFLQSGTTTRVPVYADAAFATELSNPVEANGAGKFPNIYLDTDSYTYRARLLDSDGAPMGYDVDPYLTPTPYVAGLFEDMADYSITVDVVWTTGYGSLGVGTARYVYDASVDEAHVTANPYTSFMTANSRGFTLATDQTITAQMFGATGGNEAVDDGPALNAFFAWVLANRVPHADCYGDFFIATPLVLDNEPNKIGLEVVQAKSVIEWGDARFTATAAMDRMISMNEITRTHFAGKPQFRGHPTYANDSIATANAKVGIYLEDCLSTSFEGADFQRLAYAGFELFSQPTINNNISLGHVYAKRVGSGDDTTSRSVTANWSGATQNGGYNSIVQYTEMTVDALPSTYITGSSAGAPERQMLVEISGKLHAVTYVDRASNLIRVFPRILTALGTSGTLRYHYGAAVALRDEDTNVISWDQVVALMSSCAVEFSCLYAGAMGGALAESCGSAVRIGAAPAGQVNGGSLAHLYCETSNTFNVVLVGRSCIDFKILSRSADRDASKDVDVYTPLGTLSAVEGYYSEGFNGLTLPASEGWHYRRKRKVDGEDNETLDFGKPATFDNPAFYTLSATDALQLTLVAGTAAFLARRRQFGYDIAEVTILGRTATGAPAGNITVVPPTGHTINGGAASASLVIPGGSFDGPVRLVIYDGAGSGAWIVRAERPRAGYVGVTTRGDAAATLTAYTDKVTQRWTTTLTADRAVTLSTTGAVEGNRFRISRPAGGAFNLNVGTGPLKALAASQWCDVEYDGSAWVLTAYGSL